MIIRVNENGSLVNNQTYTEFIKKEVVHFKQDNLDQGG